MAGYINKLVSLSDVYIQQPNNYSIVSYYGGQWKQSVRNWDIREVATVGLSVNNKSSATAGYDQFSPAFHIGGAGWKTGTSESVSCDWIVYSQPSGAATPTYPLYFQCSQAGAAYSDAFFVTQAGIGQFSNSMAAYGTTGYVRAGTVSGGIIMQANTSSYGLGTSDYLYNAANRPLGLIAGGRTNAAQIGVAIGTNTAIATASLNDALVMASIGNVDNATVWQQFFGCYPKHFSMPSFAVAGAPAAANGSIGYCTNGAGGSECLAVRLGGVWYRVSVGAAIAAV